MARLPTRHGLERPVGAVPAGVRAVLVLALVAQVALHATRPAPVARATSLPSPPSAQVLRVVSLGEEPALARLLMLWLQSFDNQPGVSIPFRSLDYDRLTLWLERVLALDPESRYPLLSAARVYGEVGDEGRMRTMIAFVERAFLVSPQARWPWMAHAIYLARHRLGDLALALRLSRELREHTVAAAVPGWARQMELFVRDAMGDAEGARVLLGGLIESGELTDPNEIRFLEQRLGEN